MKSKAICLLCVFCLLLSLAGCGTSDTAAPVAAAPELLAGTGFKLDATPLGSGYQLLGSSCISGETLFFLAERLHEDTDIPLPDLTLFSVDAAGQVTVVLDYLPPAEEEEDPTQVTHLGFFPDGGGGVWVAEAVSHTEDREGEDPVTVNQTRLRRFSAAGTLLGLRDVTDHISAFQAGAAVGDDLVLAGDGKLCVFSPGSTISRPLNGALYFLTPYDGSVGIIGESPTGLLSLSTMDLTTKTPGSAVTLPFNIYAVTGSSTVLSGGFLSGRGTQLDYSCQGNIFTYAGGKVKKLVDWMDYGFLPGNIAVQGVTSTGNVMALHAKNSELTLLSLTEPGTVTLAQTELTLGMVQSDAATLELVLSHNQTSPHRIRVANYAEYAAMGQTAQAMLRLQLSRGAGPDLLFSPERDLSVTELAEEYLADLYPFLQQDSQLQREGMISSVLHLQESEDRLLSVTPGFVFSTAVSRASLVGTEPLTVARAINLYEKFSSGASSALEPYTRRETVLREHIARNSLIYGTAESSFRFNNTTFRDGLSYAALFPDDIDWTRFEAMGSPAGWSRVRAGTQLLLSGQYYGFSSLSQDLYAVGSDAVLCGYPDVDGGHVMELWQTYGILESCPDKEAAWSFLRTVLLCENQLKYGTTGFPSNNSAFYAKGQEAMQAQGNQALMDGSSTLNVPANLSQEQYDAIWSAVQSTTARYHSDYEVFAAVWPEAKAYFDGQKSLSETASSAQSAAENYRTPKVNG